MAILFDGWEIQWLQQTLNRWAQYKGVGAFSPHEHELVASIKPKVQVVDGVPVSFTSEENLFLQSLLYRSKQDYGRGAGNSVFEDTRSQTQQRSVYLNNAILAKLRGDQPPIVNPGVTESLES